MLRTVLQKCRLVKKYLVFERLFSNEPKKNATDAKDATDASEASVLKALRRLRLLRLLR